ncbi:hypothetical protein HGRIS_003701 [Hohenbuehelia grisea]|uniref:DUF6533 domain-containing protein n=1 Tax=Hohenbuehelia grisea TaxID=104357 RepID=A0ABR3JG45_9AGAR
MDSTPIPALVEYSVAASLTLLLYDLLCTLDREIKQFWRTPVTFTTVIFFLNRYLPFVDTTISLMSECFKSESSGVCPLELLVLVLSGDYSPKTCERGFKAVLCATQVFVRPMMHTISFVRLGLIFLGIIISERAL